MPSVHKPYWIEKPASEVRARNTTERKAKYCDKILTFISKWRAKHHFVIGAIPAIRMEQFTVINWQFAMQCPRFINLIGVKSPQARHERGMQWKEGLNTPIKLWAIIHFVVGTIPTTKIKELMQQPQQIRFLSACTGGHYAVLWSRWRLQDGNPEQTMVSKNLPIKI